MIGSWLGRVGPMQFNMSSSPNQQFPMIQRQAYNILCRVGSTTCIAVIWEGEKILIAIITLGRGVSCVP